MSNFLDYVQITIVSGNGGNGLASFRREKYVPFGGPDGGDGGNGGSIIFVGKKNLISLKDFTNKKSFRAKNGINGGKRKKSGKNGPAVVIKVPLGTEIVDLKNMKKLADIIDDGQEVEILKGGIGGLGNVNFKSSKNRAPRKFTSGKKGGSLKVGLNLKIIANVSLIGFPNVGKSSIIKQITNSKAIIGNYPFTTVSPNLGVCKFEKEDVVIADIPGLIKDAYLGKGLGHKFLKHIERSESLIEVLDLSCEDIKELNNQHKQFLAELNMYNKQLKKKIKLIVLNKHDLCSFDKNIKLFKGLKGIPIIKISCKNNFNLEKFKNIVKRI